jgi:hypothetical protein
MNLSFANHAEKRYDYSSAARKQNITTMGEFENSRSVPTCPPRARPPGRRTPDAGRRTPDAGIGPRKPACGTAKKLAARILYSGDVFVIIFQILRGLASHRLIGG